MLPDTIQLRESLTVATLSSTAMQCRSGEAEVITVAGSAVTLLVPALMHELVRPRHWPDVVRSLTNIATPEVIEECAEILFAKGVLVEAPSTSPRPDGERAVHSFFAHPPYRADEILDRVRTSKLGIAGDMGAEELLIGKLQAHGFRQVASLQARLSPDQIEGLDLLIVLAPHIEASTLESINRACLQTGTSWLPVDIYSGPFCALGPLVTPGTGACYECYRARVRSNLQSAADPYDDFIEFQKSTGTSVAQYGMLPAGIDIALGIVCLEALKLVTGFEIPACIGHNVIVNLIDLELQRHRVLQIPRCPACSSAASAPQGHWTV